MEELNEEEMLGTGGGMGACIQDVKDILFDVKGHKYCRFLVNKKIKKLKIGIGSQAITEELADGDSKRIANQVNARAWIVSWKGRVLTFRSTYDIPGPTKVWISYRDCYKFRADRPNVDIAPWKPAIKGMRID